MPKRAKLKNGTNPIAKPKSEVSLAQMPWDPGASGKANQANLVPESASDIDPETGKEINPNSVTRNRRLTFVEKYRRAGKLTTAQANIAVELRNAAEGAKNADPLAALGRKIDRTTGIPDPQATAYDGRRKFHRMWPLVPVSSRYIVQRVVLDDDGLIGIPGVRGRAGAAERHMQRLRQGLDALAAAWGRENA